MPLKWPKWLMQSTRAVKPALPRESLPPPLPASLSCRRVLQMLRDARHVVAGWQHEHWSLYSFYMPKGRAEPPRPSDEPWPYLNMLCAAVSPRSPCPERPAGARPTGPPQLYFVFSRAPEEELGVAWTQGHDGLTFVVDGEALHTRVADMAAVQAWFWLYDRPPHLLASSDAPAVRSLQGALASARQAAPKVLRQLLPEAPPVDVLRGEWEVSYAELESLPNWPVAAQLAAELERRVPEPLSRAQLLLGWYGCGAGPWGDFPAYEQLALQLLRRQSRLTIMCAISAPEHTQDILRGGLRYLLNPATRRQLAELGNLPPRLKLQALHFAQGHSDGYMSRWAEGQLYRPQEVFPRWAPAEYGRRWALGSTKQRTEQLRERLSIKSLSRQGAALLRHLGVPAAEYCGDPVGATTVFRFRRASTSVQGWMERLGVFGRPALQRAALALARASLDLCPQADLQDARSLVDAAEACVQRPCGQHTEVLVAALHGCPSASWAGAQETAPQFAQCAVQWAARSVLADTVEYAVSALDAALATHAAVQIEALGPAELGAANDDPFSAEPWARGVVRSALGPWVLGFHDPLRG